MKKSRVIIPALAMIAFSVAASVAGTVAWFTASRTAQISAGTYAVVKTSADLECVVADGVGTTADNTTKTVDLSGNKLTDGSFDHNEKNIYTPDSTGKTLAPAPKNQISLSNENLATLLERGETGGKKIYTAVTFDLTFTVSFGSIDADVGLFLDNSAENKTSFKVSDNATPKTATGFRMAFVQKTAPSTGSSINPVVLADLQTAAKCKYISGTDDTTLSGTSYVATDRLIDSAYDAALPTEATERATAIARPDCLGVFKFSSGNRVSLAYTVVAWFEGTDENVVNRASAEEYQAVVAQLNFEAINLKAA